MKRILSIFSIAAVMVACNTKPRTGIDSFVVAPAVNKSVVDTAGWAQFQMWKAQMYRDSIQQLQGYATAPVTNTYHRSYAPVRSSSRTRYRSYQGGSMTSESGHTAKTVRRRGWSKAAKGAVIGAGSGAVLGAVINKRNRVAGGVVGGVIGGGVGYGIGRHLDKKDGRY